MTETLTYFNEYIGSFHDEQEKNTVQKTSNELLTNIQDRIAIETCVYGLLFGNVQSGKTRQMLGAISLLADNQFPVFLLLTTDNVKLQEQTLARVRKSLQSFCVIGEWDDVDFLNCKLSKPLVVVLKKNTRVLKKWRGLLNTSGYCAAKPLVIFDDEADAASLNTKVNNNSTSTINKHLNSIKDMASSCVYIQVTATPQAVLLQSQFSGWKPEFVVYFAPGKDYLGGEFFFSDPPSYCIRFTSENELDDVRTGDSYIPEGLRKSLLNFLVICAHKYNKQDFICNFLIHPGVKKDDHDVFANRISEHLNLLLLSIEDPAFIDEIRSTWEDLKKTQPDILNYDDCLSTVSELLDKQLIHPVVINSLSPYDVSVDDGYNIVVGGNCLGRGLTLPHLQVVYYCRRAKVPQADTSWQHSRMFGYDRERGLMRVFIPKTLYHLFCSLNQSNDVLIRQIAERGLNGVQLVFSDKVKPTRSNVLDKKEISAITGGVNFFPFNPSQDVASSLDTACEKYEDAVAAYDVGTEVIEFLLSCMGTTVSDDWDKDKFLNCVRALSSQRPNISCKLIVRRDRDIAMGTGTLLSPNDRKLGDSFIDSIVLTLYRVNGNVSKGWKGSPFWIPNIRFPNNSCYYDTKTN